jgi:chromosome segregation ATPase
MSGITQASGFPMATASGDQVFALLHMISDEKLFRARLVQLQAAEENAQKILLEAEKQTTAANKLQKETNEAQATLDSYRAAFAQTKDAFDKRSNEIAAAQMARENSTNDLLNELNKDRDHFEKYKLRTLEDLNNRKAALDKQERQIQTAQAAVASIEAKVRAKMDQISKIYSAGE